jgi:hypothetical protein
MHTKLKGCSNHLVLVGFDKLHGVDEVLLYDCNYDISSRLAYTSILCCGRTFVAALLFSPSADELSDDNPFLVGEVFTFSSITAGATCYAVCASIPESIVFPVDVIHRAVLGSQCVRLPI